MRQMKESETTAPMPEGVSILPSDQDRAERTRTSDLTSQLTATSQMVAPAALWQRVFSFPALLGDVLVGAVATVARTFFLDPDVWWHIKNGQEILATHHWLTTDPYSFSLAGQHWIDSEWIGEVLLAAMYRLGGMRGLEALLLILGGAILIALYTLAAVRCGNSKAAFVATAAVFVLTTVSFNLRPQMVGYLFLV